MAIAFSYVDDIVIQTGGTLPAEPARFRFLHDADLADKVALNNIAYDVTVLTRTMAQMGAVQVHAADSIAIQIEIDVSQKTEETDYIYIEGLDWDGNAIADDIDVSTYIADTPFTSVNKYSSITQMTFSDAPNGAGTLWADGRIKIYQSRWGVSYEHVFDVQYRVEALLQIGDGSTASAFISINETAYFDKMPVVKASAVLYLGAPGASGVYPAFVTHWNIPAEGHFIFSGDFHMYSSILEVHTGGDDLDFWSGNVYFYNSTIRLDIFEDIIFASSLSTLHVENLLIVGAASVLVNKAFSATSDGFHVHEGDGIVFGSDNILRGYKLIDVAGLQAKVLAGFDVVLLDSETLVTNAMTEAGSTLAQSFTANFYIVGEDGAALEGATVKCYNWVSSAWVLDWTAVTGADGKLTTPEYIKHDSWSASVSGAPDNTFHGHKFEIAHADYVGMILPDVSIIKRMVPDWRIEMSLTTADLVSAAETALGTLPTSIATIEEITLESASMQYTLDVLLRTMLDGSMMVATTIASVTNQTSFILDAGSPDDDVYNDCLIIIKSASENMRKGTAFVSDYVGSSLTVALDVAVGTFTIDAGDEVYIMAMPAKLIDDVKKLIRADKFVDTAETPWVVDYKEEGTGTILMSKTMKDTSGDNVVTKNHVLGQLTQE